MGVLFAGSYKPRMFYLFTKYLLSPWDKCGVGVSKRHGLHSAYIFFKGEIENKHDYVNKYPLLNCEENCQDIESI